MQHISIALTFINLALMTFLLAQLRPANAQQQQKASQVLRGRALEIVDSLGKIRASITIQPPTVVDGKMYPQTVLLRLIDNTGTPLVTLGAADNLCYFLSTIFCCMPILLSFTCTSILPFNSFVITDIIGS